MIAVLGFYSGAHLAPKAQSLAITVDELEASTSSAPKEETASRDSSQPTPKKDRRTPVGSESLSPPQNPNLLDKYLTAIQQILKEHLRLPTALRRAKVSGKLMVSMILLPDGKLETVAIVESSGREDLDQVAIDTVKAAQPYPPPPLRSQTLTIRVPIRFQMDHS